MTPAVACVLVAVGARTPELAENTTADPVTTELFPFVTMAVIITGVELFDGSCGALATSVMALGAVTPPDEDEEEEDEDEELDVEPEEELPADSSVDPPPHALSASAASITRKL